MTRSPLLGFPKQTLKMVRLRTSLASKKKPKKFRSNILRTRKILRTKRPCLMLHAMRLAKEMMMNSPVVLKCQRSSS